MVKFALFILRLFRKPIEMWGVDFHQLYTIIKTKLVIDFRRKSQTGINSGKKKGGFKKQLIGFLFIGGFMVIPFFQFNDMLINLIINFSMMMVMMGTTLINEFTTVLFDEKDNHIILPRPISARTLLLSRIIHIQFYTGFMALAYATIPAIVIGFMFHPFTSFIYIIGVELCTWITLLSTILFYLGLSKLFNMERLKDIITYFQIALTVLIFAGYQLIPRIFEMDVIKEASLIIDWYMYAIPPFWFAGLVKAATFIGISIDVFIMVLLSLLVPLVGGFIIVKLLSKGFDKVLSHQVGNKLKTEKIRTQKGFKNLLARLFCISRIEVEGWKLVMILTSRDRKFKQSFYPTYGFILVFAFIMLKPDFSNLAASLADMSQPNKYIFFILASFFATLAVYQIPYTNTPEAAWIYNVVPVKQQGHILTGAIKAALVKFFLPIFLLVAVPFLIIIGISILPLVLLSLALLVLQTLLSAHIQKMELPFTQPYEMTQKTGKAFKFILSMLITGILIGIVYLAFLTPWWANGLYILVIFIVIKLIFLSLRKRPYHLSV